MKGIRLFLGRRLSRTALRRLVQLREVGYRLIEPLDRLGLSLNHKKGLPPLWLRRYVGPLEAFESAAAEFACLLKVLGGLKPAHRLLDIGCGCGALALQLTQYLRADLGGGYVGVDVHPPSIRWCQQHFRHDGFAFHLLDAYNATYRPDGLLGFDYTSALSHFAPFDVVAAKSVFTHLRPEDVVAYLLAIARVLRPGGRVVLTAFLFADVNEAIGGDICFGFGDSIFRHAYAHRVESAVAYHEAWMLEQLSRVGLSLVFPVFRGGWRSNHGGLTYQDVLIAQRSSA